MIRCNDFKLVNGSGLSIQISGYGQHSSRRIYIEWTIIILRHHLIRYTPVLKKVPIFSMNASNVGAIVVALQNFEMIIAFIEHRPEIRRKIISFW